MEEEAEEAQGALIPEPKLVYRVARKLFPESLLARGLAGKMPEDAARELLLTSLAAASLAATSSYVVREPLALLPLMAVPVSLLAPRLGARSLGEELDRELWHVLGALWILFAAGRNLSASLRAAARASGGKAGEWLTRAAARVEHLGPVRGLKASIALCPSARLRQLLERLLDYCVGRGEMTVEMLKRELEEQSTVMEGQLMAAARRHMLFLTMYTVVMVVFPVVLALVYVLRAIAEPTQLNLTPFMLAVMLPAPAFTALFRRQPKLYTLPRKLVASSWAIALVAAAAALAAGLSLAAAGLALGLGYLMVAKAEKELHQQALELPHFIEDVSAELAGGKTLSKAILRMQAEYRGLREALRRLRAQAELSMPYTRALRGLQKAVRHVETSSLLRLLEEALKAGASLEEALRSTSAFGRRLRAVFLRTEAEKRQHYIVVVACFAIAAASITLIQARLGLQELIPQQLSNLTRTLNLLIAAQAIAVGLVLGTARTGHLTSGLREAAILSAIALTAHLITRSELHAAYTMTAMLHMLMP
ncbi:MAG: hypothetical protein DRN96_04535 [Thermoproteota archaeon]|nr:MAG: hypothetical protein DRN96_04535 [Candidatus Korarchaeota archaeon]